MDKDRRQCSPWRLSKQTQMTSLTQKYNIQKWNFMNQGTDSLSIYPEKSDFFLQNIQN